MMHRFNHHQNKPRAHHKTYLHRINIFFLPDQFIADQFIEVFTCSQVINAFKRQNSWTDPFHVLWHQSFLTFVYKIKHGSGTRCHTVSTVSARNPLDHNPLFWQAHKKKKKRLHFQSLAANGVRLTSRRGIKQLGIFCGSFSLLLSYRRSRGLYSWKPEEILDPSDLNDSHG